MSLISSKAEGSDPLHGPPPRWPTPAGVDVSGALVVGRYALFGEIASGGMATVHFGRLLGPAGFSRVVAMKRLHRQLAKETEFVSMFVDEVRLAARVQHPNVVATLDAIEQDGELFLVMEYVHGESLAQLIRLARSRELYVPPAIAASIVCGLLHGLHAAHEATSESGEPLGIIHRDVSPQNVLVGSDGVTRVLDFGIALAARRLQNTRDSQIKGKAAYLAPERVQGREADRRSDVYGAAVVLWEALTGARLFDADNDAALFTQIASIDVPRPSTLAPGISPGLEAITMRGLDRDADKRFATAREMALALQQEVGLVAPSVVGDWVSDIAAKQLSERARYLASLSNATPSTPRGDEPHTRPMPPKDVARSTAPEAEAAPPAARPGARLAIAVLLAAVVAAAVIFRPRSESVRASTPEASAPSAVPAPALVAPLATIAPEPVKSEPSFEIEPASPKRAPSVRPRTTPPHAPVAKATETESVAPPATVEAPPRDPCRPPYTIDSDGVKHFKVDCVIDGRR
jgi:serine/threonine-protein kinase